MFELVTIINYILTSPASVIHVTCRMLRCQTRGSFSINYLSLMIQFKALNVSAIGYLDNKQ